VVLMDKMGWPEATVAIVAILAIAAFFIFGH
jgi:hypothetical protein